MTTDIWQSLEYMLKTHSKIPDRGSGGQSSESLEVWNRDKHYILISFSIYVWGRVPDKRKHENDERDQSQLKYLSMKENSFSFWSASLVRRRESMSSVIQEGYVLTFLGAKIGSMSSSMMRDWCRCLFSFYLYNNLVSFSSIDFEQDLD